MNDEQRSLTYRLTDGRFAESQTPTFRNDGWLTVTHSLTHSLTHCPAFVRSLPLTHSIRTTNDKRQTTNDKRRTSERTDGRTNERTNERTDERTNERTNDDDDDDDDDDDGEQAMRMDDDGGGGGRDSDGRPSMTPMTKETKTTTDDDVDNH